MKLSHALPALAMTLATLPAAAADPAAGQELVDTHCQSCHQSEVYTRPDHRVKDLNQLKVQVKRCEFSLGLRWFDDEIDNVTTYLNQKYYKFQ